jgi:hypothetical protein
MPPRRRECLGGGGTEVSSISYDRTAYRTGCMSQRGRQDEGGNGYLFSISIVHLSKLGINTSFKFRNKGTAFIETVWLHGVLWDVIREIREFLTLFAAWRRKDCRRFCRDLKGPGGGREEPAKGAQTGTNGPSQGALGIGAVPVVHLCDLCCKVFISYFASHLGSAFGCDLSNHLSL